MYVSWRVGEYVCQGNLSGGKLSVGELVLGEVVRGELVLFRCLPSRGTCPGGTCPKWNLSGRNLSGIHIICIPEDTYYMYPGQDKFPPDKFHFGQVPPGQDDIRKCTFLTRHIPQPCARRAHRNLPTDIHSPNVGSLYPIPILLLEFSFPFVCPHF